MTGKVYHFFRGLSILHERKDGNKVVNEKSTLRELEEQARNTKRYVDRLVKANTGLTLEEILRLGLREERPEGDGDERSVENK